MVQWITRSTHSGGVVNSGDRGLASPVKQTSIPRSGSFTEVCSVFSEVRTGLGKAWLAVEPWQKQASTCSTRAGIRGRAQSTPVREPPRARGRP